MPLSSDEKAVLRWLRKALVYIDQCGNVVFLRGRGNETISFHAATARAQGRRWGCVLCRFLDLFQRDHCTLVYAANDKQATPLTTVVQR